MYARRACLDPPRYGQYTTNHIESMNASLLEARQQLVQVQIHYIWHWTSQRRYEHRH